MESRRVVLERSGRALRVGEWRRRGPGGWFWSPWEPRAGALRSGSPGHPAAGRPARRTGRSARAHSIDHTCRWPTAPRLRWPGRCPGGRAPPLEGSKGEGASKWSIRSRAPVRRAFAGSGTGEGVVGRWRLLRKVKGASKVEVVVEGGIRLVGAVVEGGIRLVEVVVEGGIRFAGECRFRGPPPPPTYQGSPIS